jgi:hypothetical protein
MTDQPRYVIWSFEHQAWWAPDRRGYTEMLDQAGRYDDAEAQQIVRHANVVRQEELLMTVESAQVMQVLAVRAWMRNAQRATASAHEPSQPE